MLEVQTGYGFERIKAEMVCSVGRKEVGIGWGVGELIQRDRGSNIDVKVNWRSLVDQWQKWVRSQAVWWQVLCRVRPGSHYQRPARWPWERNFSKPHFPTHSIVCLWELLWIGSYEDQIKWDNVCLVLSSMAGSRVCPTEASCIRWSPGNSAPFGPSKFSFITRGSLATVL